MSRPPKARKSLDEYGIDAVCADLSSGISMIAISSKVGVSFGSLSAWLAADSERSARATDCRRSASRYWDEKAEDELRSAGDPFELTKARELASHFRWRASKIDPGGYGDKMALTGSDGGPIQVERVTFTKDA